MCLQVDVKEAINAFNANLPYKPIVVATSRRPKRDKTTQAANNKHAKGSQASTPAVPDEAREAEVEEKNRGNVNIFGHKVRPSSKSHKTSFKSSELPSVVTLCGQKYCKVPFDKNLYPPSKCPKKPLRLPSAFDPSKFLS